MRIVRDRIERPPPPPARAQEVRAILEAVRVGGDEAVLDLTERFDHAELAPAELRVEPRELEAALGALEPAVLRGLRTAIANVRQVARGAAARAGERSTCPRASASRSSSCRWAAPASTCPAAARPIPRRW